MILFKKPRTAEDQLSQGQRETCDNIRQGFEELKMAEEGKLKFRPVKELMDKLSEDQEDAYLLAAMEEVKDETPVSDEKAKEFESWLKSQRP